MRPRAAGAGGQHVNKTASKATLTVATADLLGSTTKLARVRDRLGESVVVSCQESRSQWRNRRTCIERLVEIIDEAAAPPAAPRRPTKPSRGAQERRIARKKKHGDKFPSMISFITGPSRTGDIERILVLGAHGPKKLTILCV